MVPSLTTSSKLAVPWKPRFSVLANKSCNSCSICLDLRLLVSLLCMVRSDVVLLAIVLESAELTPGLWRQDAVF